MTSAPVRELKNLVELARDKSQQSRSILVAAINDLYSDDEQLLSDQEVEEEELSRSLSFFDETSIVAARAILRRWQRDPDYLNALRLLEQTDRVGKA